MPLAWRIGFAVALLAAGAPATAQEFVGAAKCFGCHKLGRKAAQDSHGQSLNQLADPKAAGYAKATGGDAKHPKCMACHGPVAVAAGPAPVSCETCHGPGKGWLEPHQESAFYAQPPAQWKGLRNMKDNAREVARTCVTCHVVDDKAIVAAGHPTGAAFDAGRDLASPRMVHWPSGSVGDARVRGYDRAFYAAVTREGAPLVAARAAAGGGGKSAAAPAVKAPPAAGAPAVAGGAPRVAPRVPPPAPGRPPAADDEYADLGDDEFVTPAAAAPPPARPIARLALPDRPTGEFERPPVRVAPRATPPPPTSVPPTSVPATSVPATSPPAIRPLAVVPAGPAGIVEMRGRAALVLADLLRQKKKLDLPPPMPPAEFAGPDGELLRLQDEILALALETARRTP